MKSPQIHCIVDKDKAPLVDYLRNIGALAPGHTSANIVLTDDPARISKGRLCFLLADEPASGYIHIPANADHQKIYETILQIAGAIQNLQTPEDLLCPASVSQEEAAIIGGFARHFSHNVLNSLLAAGGFLRQIKPLTDKTEHNDYLWKTVEDKLRSIEELVNGYNDYNHVLTLKMTEKVEISSFFHDLIVAIGEKTFGKAFSAYLSYYTNRYSMSYDFRNPRVRTIDANPLFLKLAFCYIFKDTTQYLGTENATVNFQVVTKSEGERLSISIRVNNASMPPEILDTIFQPWRHQMFTQSFDYWGLAIAQTIIIKHGGDFTAENTGKDLVYKITI